MSNDQFKKKRTFASPSKSVHHSTLYLPYKKKSLKGFYVANCEKSNFILDSETKRHGCIHQTIRKNTTVRIEKPLFSECLLAKRFHTIFSISFPECQIRKRPFARRRGDDRSHQKMVCALNQRDLYGGWVGGWVMHLDFNGSTRPGARMRIYNMIIYYIVSVH